MHGVLDLPASDSRDANSDRDLDGFEIEQRFLLTRAQTVGFLRAVSSHTVPELHDRARPLSFTRTTYLDSVDLAYLRSCAGRVARRLRMREYAVASNLVERPLLTGHCFLELKQSAGAVRSKLRLAAPREILRTDPRWLDRCRRSSSGIVDADGQSALVALRAEDRRAPARSLPDHLVSPVEPQR